MPDLPGRPETHTRSTWSTRAFASVLPSGWLIHPLEEDYGIDRRVEVFENGRTTGIFFNVQLKSTEVGSGERPAESIKRTTLNYWAQTPDATLVVIAHEPTKSLWYRWSHLLPHDEHPETRSRQVRCEELLDESSAPALGEEARAWRMARELHRYLPVDVHLTGTTLYGQSAAPLKRAIAQKLSGLQSFTRVVHSAPSLPYMTVSIEDTRVMAGLRGDFSRQITWGLNGERDHNALASDVIASLAVSCAVVGAEGLAVRLLRVAAPHTRTLLEANALGFIMSLLTKHEESETVLTLMHRTSAQEGHWARDVALAAVWAAGPTGELAKAVAHTLRDAARTWTRPAMGLYNAANSLRDLDPSEAIALFDEAAQADPAYRTRGYWWKEKGTAHWNLRNTALAEACYRKAVELGDPDAAAYLGDVLTRTGRYGEARDVFEHASIWDGPEHAQWRLTYNALRLIVEDFGIVQQGRDDLGIPDFHPPLSDDSPAALETSALAAIQADALNGWAYAGLASAWRADGDKSPLMASTAAAVIINVAGDLWMDVLIDTLLDETHDEDVRILVAQDAMWCAQRYFGDSFAEVILDYPLPDEELRAPILDFFETVKLTRQPLEVRRHPDDGGNHESFYIQTDPRSSSDQ
jgi:tetratricopeptide (TPR) repeat protein